MRACWNSGIVVSIVESQVQGRGMLLAVLPVIDKVVLANTRGNGGGLLRDP